MICCFNIDLSRKLVKINLGLSNGKDINNTFHCYSHFSYAPFIKSVLFQLWKILFILLECLEGNNNNKLIFPDTLYTKLFLF